MAGNIEDIYDDMIAVSYFTNEQVRSTQKGIFFDKVSYEKIMIRKTMLINIRYIAKIEFLS